MPYKDIIVFPPDGKIDVDSEIRRVKKGDITDALNSRWGTKNDGSVYAVENIKGNELVLVDIPEGRLPEGNNKVIGTCSDFPNNRLILFLYNDKNDHCIFQIDMTTKMLSPILWKVTDLEFSDGYIMNAHVLDGVLYWLNTNGELKNLIIESAIKMTNKLYSDGIGYWWLYEYVVQPNL